MRSNRAKASVPELPAEEDLLQQIMLTANVVWRNQLSRKRIDGWLNNFTGKVLDQAHERRLALWLLANFVYYDEQEVRNLCRVLYREVLRKHLLEKKTPTGQSVLVNTESILAGSRFAPLGRPGESGSLILYFFRQENYLPLISFSEGLGSLPDKVKTVLFVDDVTLTGTQALGYIGKQMAAIGVGKSALLLTLFSTSDAVNLLESQGVKVVSCVTLDDRSRCFSTDSSVFHHFPTQMEPCRLFVEHYGKSLEPDNPLGYSEGAYLFGFFYNTPDNTLPIFWSTTGGWQPVVKRYSKQYGAKILGSLPYELGQFI